MRLLPIACPIALALILGCREDTSASQAGGKHSPASVTSSSSAAAAAEQRELAEGQAVAASARTREEAPGSSVAKAPSPEAPAPKPASMPAHGGKGEANLALRSPTEDGFGGRGPTTTRDPHGYVAAGDVAKTDEPAPVGTLTLPSVVVNGAVTGAGEHALRFQADAGLVAGAPPPPATKAREREKMLDSSLLGKKGWGDGPSDRPERLLQELVAEEPEMEETAKVAFNGLRGDVNIPAVTETAAEKPAENDRGGEGRRAQLAADGKFGELDQNQKRSDTQAYEAPVGDRLAPEQGRQGADAEIADERQKHKASGKDNRASGKMDQDDQDLTVDALGKELKQEELKQEAERDKRGEEDGLETTDKEAAQDELANAVLPTTFLPNAFYFENTYLGGDAGYQESLRRLDAALTQVGAPHRSLTLAPPVLDAPPHDGLGLTVRTDRATIDGASRVFLEVGLRGSDRFGWRRPPLELVIVVDGGAVEASAASAFVEAVLGRLGPQDRLGVVSSGSAEPIAQLQGLRSARSELASRADTMRTAFSAEGSLDEGLAVAGRLLVEASQHRTTAPGTQVVLVLADPNNLPELPDARRNVSELTLGGIVTSAVAFGDDEPGGLWELAAAGHGNAHAAEDDAALGGAVDSELELLSRVVARLIRVNVKLAPGVHAVRVLGSRPLLEEEVKVVKAAEVATDRRLSDVLGIKADRGDDDDGIQTVIPVFYGGDTHVVMLELVADRPGPVADVTLRYKDLVNMDNATTRGAIAIGASSVGERGARDIGLTVRALEDAEALRAAAEAVARGDVGAASGHLEAASARVRGAFGALLTQVSLGNLGAGDAAEAFRLAARRGAGGGG